MPDTLVEDSADDLLRGVYGWLLTAGEATTPSKGVASERRAVTLELRNARARLSRTESRGRIFSSIGELCWYLGGTADLAAIEYYLPRYRDAAEGQIVPSGYGPRLRRFDGLDQFENCIAMLARRPDTRRAVIQLFDHEDLATERKEVPCTCTLQFLLRREHLHLIVYMRSNDACRGLPHDIFAFTMIQELVASRIGARLGTYSHMVGSLHLYDEDRAQAQRFINEGWQSDSPMPAMPPSASGSELDWLINIERALRESDDPLSVALDGAPDYWIDVARLLAIYGLIKRDRSDEIDGLRSKLVWKPYDVYVADRLAR